MAGVSFEGETLVVERPPNALDELALEFSAVASRCDVDHAFIAGYLAILTGRARATDDVDVLIEELSASEVNALVDELEDAGFWGPAMPLEEMHGNLSAGTNIWVAPADQTTPHLEVKFPTDEFDRASLSNSINARVGGRELPIGPLELQIAYKLYLAAEKDLEDAAHLYLLFEETLRIDRLEDWVGRLGVEDSYERLKSI